jgi:hypothetical protein
MRTAPLTLPSFRDLANQPNANGWEINIGHASSENHCDPIQHYIFKVIMNTVEVLNNALESTDSVTEAFNFAGRNNLECMRPVFTDGKYVSILENQYALSVKMNLFEQNYTIVITYL